MGSRGELMAGVKFSVDVKKFTNDMDKVGQRMARGSSAAAHILAFQMAKDTEPYVPAMTKSLSNRTLVLDDTVIYPGPYARFLYNGKLMIDPNTGSAWAPKGATKVVTGKDLDIKHAVHDKAQSHWFEASKAQNLPKWRNVARRAMQRELRR